MTDYTKEIIKRSVHNKNFKIIRYVKIEGLKSNERKPDLERFVSPLFGDKVPDDILVPEFENVLGDNTKRLDPFRTVKKQTKEELNVYDDFNILTHNSRVEFLGGRDYQKEQRELEEKNKKLKEKEEELLRREKELNTEKRIIPIEEFLVKEEKEVENKVKLNLEPVLEEEDFKPRPGLFESKFKSKASFENLEEEEENLKPKESVKEKQVYKHKKYVLPDPKMFETNNLDSNQKPEWILKQIEIINNTLEQFNIEGEVTGSTKGPTVTRYEVSLKPGVNVNRILTIQDNIKMNLSSNSIRIEAPIPGKPYVGLEIPNDTPEIVPFGNIVNSKEFINSKDKPLLVALGVDIDGKNVYADIAKMPHGLIAGATNSGKSVCVNTVLASLLIKNTPDDLKLILIDPKVVELFTYNDLPHLITPVISDVKMASEALKWVVDEMEKRYVLLAKNNSRDINTFNANVLSGRIDLPKLPFIVVIIDELADLMMVAANDVETSIQRITQKARAAGIHLIVATQRPSVDVVKGSIKSNIPARIAFRVASYNDSMTILDGAGADKLLGKGDMLFKLVDQAIRLQGAYIKDSEIDALKDFITNQRGPEYLFAHDDIRKQVERIENKDELFEDVARFVVFEQKASINQITEEFGIGFNRAQGIVKNLENYNIVSKGQATKPREVLVNESELEEILTND